jgi:hypothetical protein
VGDVGAAVLGADRQWTVLILTGQGASLWRVCDDQGFATQRRSRNKLADLQQPSSSFRLPLPLRARRGALDQTAPVKCRIANLNDAAGPSCRTRGTENGP